MMGVRSEHLAGVWINIVLIWFDLHLSELLVVPHL
ncbi:hypothetical protein Natpe_1804 [Natrinema pellirubrum DSM 15624]|uniref:Uncharacterized protein n=1 Tax=Natrinema pellirubrum (strain DSM 15624 / CIP 106293 / JCM 10476 / NCIMB 786 / 157) TaxID=797303 RepID=L0JMT1_NATP1|nr:hypothetical protein Natpe_1804 [Natrinema pellirubrum DSM 15624]